MQVKDRLWLPTIQQSLPRRSKKLNSIHSEGIRIYTGAFRTSSVEALLVEANVPPLELRLLYKLKICTSYIETLNTLDKSEDQNYKENERSMKFKRVYLRKLERRYMEEQKELKEMNITTPQLVNNILLCYGGKRIRNGSKRKQYFLQHKEKHSNNKEAYTDGSKSTGRKVGFAVVFRQHQNRSNTRRSINPHS